MLMVRKLQEINWRDDDENEKHERDMRTHFGGRWGSNGDRSEKAPGAVEIRTKTLHSCRGRAVTPSAPDARIGRSRRRSRHLVGVAPKASANIALHAAQRLTEFDRMENGGALFPDILATSGGVHSGASTCGDTRIPR